MTTRKQRYQADRAAWRLALVEGRVIRHNGGIVLTSFPLLSDALAFMHRLQLDGLDAERVQVSMADQLAKHGIGKTPTQV